MVGEQHDGRRAEGETARANPRGVGHTRQATISGEEMLQNRTQITRLVREIVGCRIARRTELAEGEVDRGHDVAATGEMLREVRFACATVLQRVPVEDERVGCPAGVEWSVAQRRTGRRRRSGVPHLGVERAKGRPREGAVGRRGARLIDEPQCPDTHRPWPAAGEICRLARTHPATPRAGARDPGERRRDGKCGGENPDHLASVRHEQRRGT